MGSISCFSLFPLQSQPGQLEKGWDPKEKVGKREENGGETSVIFHWDQISALPSSHPSLFPSLPSSQILEIWGSRPSPSRAGSQSLSLPPGIPEATFPEGPPSATGFPGFGRILPLPLPAAPVQQSPRDLGFPSGCSSPSPHRSQTPTPGSRPRE